MNLIKLNASYKIYAMEYLVLEIMQLLSNDASNLA